MHLQPDLVPCTVVEFDHLISKAKLTEEDKFQDFVNPVTRTEVSSEHRFDLYARWCCSESAYCTQNYLLSLIFYLYCAILSLLLHSLLRCATPACARSRLAR